MSGIQIAQCRQYLQTFVIFNVGIICYPWFLKPYTPTLDPTWAICILGSLYRGYIGLYWGYIGFRVLGF